MNYFDGFVNLLSYLRKFLKSLQPHEGTLKFDPFSEQTSSVALLFASYRDRAENSCHPVSEKLSEAQLKRSFRMSVYEREREREKERERERERECDVRVFSSTRK